MVEQEPKRKLDRSQVTIVLLIVNILAGGLVWQEFKLRQARVAAAHAEEVANAWRRSYELCSQRLSLEAAYGRHDCPAPILPILPPIISSDLSREIILDMERERGLR